jgi:hypothetical protein
MARLSVGAWTWAGLIAWLAVILLSVIGYARNWGASKVIFRAVTEGGCLVALVGLVFLIRYVVLARRASREERRNIPPSP